MREIILYGLFTVYIIYSLIYSQEFFRTNRYYSKRQKNVHLILIWLIPFIWVLLLKSLNKPTPGSHYFSEKRRENTLENIDGDSTFHESGKGF
jgi:hypothetical protein